jgi:ribosomal subunit interface protein
MSINIKTTNISSGGAAESYLTEKLESLKKLVDFNDANVVAQVEIGKNTNHHRSGEDLFRAEINVKMGKREFRVVSEEADLHAAIDTMKDELSRQIRDEKDQHQTEVRKGRAKIKDMMRSDEAGENVEDLL